MITLRRLKSVGVAKNSDSLVSVNTKKILFHIDLNSCTVIPKLKFN